MNDTLIKGILIATTLYLIVEVVREIIRIYKCDKEE